MSHYPAQPYSVILDTVIANGGAGLTAIAASTLLGNGLGDTAFPQALNANAARTILGLATFNSPTFSGLTLTGLQSFTGTSSVGLRLKSLTSVEYGLLIPGTGDLFVDSTTDRIDARLARGTVELVDTAGGQTINGALTLTGLLDLRKSATANILQFSTTAFLRTDTSQLSIFDTGLGRSNIALWRTGNFVVGSTTLIAASSGVDATTNVVDTSLSRNAAGVWQMGTTANNALGSLNLTNLTASGTVTAGVVTGSTSLNTNAISRNTPTATLNMGYGSMATGFHSVTIGAGGSLTNSTGIAGYLRLDSIVNQTGTAGSTDFLINRTETALGSGAHNFLDCQRAGVSLTRIDRTGSITTLGVTNFLGATQGTNSWWSATVQDVVSGNFTIGSQNSGAGFIFTSAGVLILSALGSSTNAWAIDSTAGHLRFANTSRLAFSSTTSSSGATDVNISRNAAGVGQIGTTANNASGSLLLTNLTASGNCNTNSIRRGNSNSTLSLGVEAVLTDFYNVTILSSLKNTSGVAGQLAISSTIDQNASDVAGSTDFLINRTEDGLGSGAHNFFDMQVAGVSRITGSNTGNLTTSGTITYSSIAFPELVTNGGFNSDTAWSKGTGWTISGGTAVATGVVSFADINQNLPAVVLGQTYIVSFTVTRTSGSLTAYIGTSGVSQGVVGTIVSSGTYSFLFHKNTVDAAKTILFRAE
jgi:hypothetical protein